jgi:16S rRNA (guanine527-N7)-methyltransferase
MPGEWSSSTSDDVLLGVLGEARDRGYLGPGPLRPHLEHSRAFLALSPRAPSRAIDLGSGGGVPGLVLAVAWPDSDWVLLDASQRRVDFLNEAVMTLGITSRVTVCRQRAEEAGRDPDLRASADLVVARSFGPPAVAAECAAPFLRRGGHVIVAEPPGGDPSRWPAADLARLGLRVDGTVTEPWALQRLVQADLCPDRYPRRTGIPLKRPLFPPAERGGV